MYKVRVHTYRYHYTSSFHLLSPFQEQSSISLGIIVVALCFFSLAPILYFCNFM